MPKEIGKFRERIRRLGKSSVAQLGEFFARWVKLPENFGDPKRERLFSPLKNLLDVFIPGAFSRRIMQGSASRIPCVDSRRRGEGRFAKHGGLLQGARKT